MKCYFHQEVDAVSSCKACGKYMCKACYDAGNKGVCADCSMEQVREKQKAFRREYEKKNEYVRTAIMCLLVGAFIGLGNMKSVDGLLEKIIVVSMSAYGFFAVHAGINILRAAFKHVLSWGVVLIFGWPVLLILVAASLVIGSMIAVPMLIAKKREYRNFKMGL